MLVLAVVIVWCMVSSLAALGWAAFSAVGRGPKTHAEHTEHAEHAEHARTALAA